MDFISEEVVIDVRNYISENGIKLGWIAKQLNLSKPMLSMIFKQERRISSENLYKLISIINK